MKAILAALATMSVIGSASAEDLKLTSYYANDGSLFPVASTLIEGSNEVLLVDAQFEQDDANELVKMIKATGKPLNNIFISHKDPDFYFGLDVIQAAFPEAKIWATPETVKGVKETAKLKLDYWGPILGKNAPKTTVLPEVLEGNSLSVDGKAVEVVGLNGSDPVHTYLWVPSVKAVLGGVVLAEGHHVWMADNATKKSRETWLAKLEGLKELNPQRVIATHVVGTSTEDESIIKFTHDYIVAFEAAVAKTKNSAELVEAMQKAYPQFDYLDDLKLGAEVVKGERSWP